METTRPNEPNESEIHSFLRRHMNGVDIAAGIIIVLLVMTSVFFILRYAQLETELNRVRQTTITSQVNAQVLDFTKLFIQKVLKATGEIDFETRLNLESAVRGLKDEQILAAWQAFTGSKTEPDAQTAVKNLLEILASKLKS